MLRYTLVVLLGVGLTACAGTSLKTYVHDAATGVAGQLADSDPMAALEEPTLQTLEGVVLPFSVSVPTAATHRLEADGKLIAYLASSAVPLQESENTSVELTGRFRPEKMRRIFWVEAVTTPELPLPTKTPPPTEQHYTGDGYQFTVPADWRWSPSPEGIAYFFQAEDELKKVFLSFERRAITSPDTPAQSQIGSLPAIKTVVLEANGTERQEVILRSQASPGQEYRFWFTSAAEDYSRKRAFAALLNTFLEGEPPTPESPPTAPAETSPSTDPSTPPTPDPLPEEGNPSDYIPMLGSRYHSYTSNYYGFNVQIPWQYYYMHFGPVGESITTIGFATGEIPTEQTMQFRLDILKTQNPPSTLREIQNGDTITVHVPRDSRTLFSLTGPAALRDTLLSIAHSITQ